MSPKRRSTTRKQSGFLSRNMKVLIATILILAVSGAAYPMITTNSPKAGLSPTRVLLATSMGEITIELYQDMPITSENFRNLTEHGVYNGTLFHRVVPGFVIQSGDATTKGITVPTIPDELPNKHSNVRGSVAMAKTSAPNSATSQFYINLGDNTYLDSNYSVFGRVIEGIDVVDQIGSVPTNTTTQEPLQAVTLIRAELID
jgi:peptidylprolyl isomerase